MRSISYKKIITFAVLAFSALLMSSGAMAATSASNSFGKVLSLTLKPQNVASYQVSYIPQVTLTGASQCPAIGDPVLLLDLTNTSFPVNDVVSFFDASGKKVLDITHNRATTTSANHDVPTRVVTNRQDWTRIRDNPMGIDGVTGIRHYIGNFGEESQRDANGNDVVTAHTNGVISLREPLNFSSGPYAGIATRVDVINWIGPQGGLLEPLSVGDARGCGYLETGIVAPIDPVYENTCKVGENIVACK